MTQLNQKTRCGECNLLECCGDPLCPNSKASAWCTEGGACTTDKITASIWRTAYAETLTPLYAAPTSRERELYDALTILASAVMARRKEWENWVQGSVEVAPIVRRALRLEGSVVPSHNSPTEAG